MEKNKNAFQTNTHQEQADISLLATSRSRKSLCPWVPPQELDVKYFFAGFQLDNSAQIMRKNIVPEKLSFKIFTLNTALNSAELFKSPF